jgi:hypothetical protein
MNFWDPGPGQSGTDGLNHDQPMHKIGTNRWELTLTCPAGEKLEYKYTRGAWTQVEKDARGQEVPNRVLWVPETDAVQTDTVRNWADITSAVTDNAGASFPRGFELQQNYPNPFNPSTTIRYGLPRGSKVALIVFNTGGQQVAVLEQGYREGGYHEVRFDAGRFADGVYFYRLKAGDFEEVKKLVLLR